MAEYFPAWQHRLMPHWVDVLPQFLLACLVLAAIPGPATALFLQRSVRDGRAAGLAAVAGNEIGVFGWTLAGGAGLSARFWSRSASAWRRRPADRPLHPYHSEATR